MFTSTVVANTTYPFVQPFIRPNHRSNRGGFYIAFPVSYTRSLRIIFRWKGSQKLSEGKIWRHLKECREKRTNCDLKTYHAVVANKLVHGTKLKSHFTDYDLTKLNRPKTKYLKSMTKTVATMASSPVRYAPGLRSECKLVCQTVHPGKEVVIYSSQSAKVIQSLRFRLYDIKNGKPSISKNWKRILITMRWDGKDPQVNEIPLAGLFVTGLDTIREVRSLTSGVGYTTCHTQGEHASEIEPNDLTAYLFYEMPFWKSANITVKIPNGFQSAISCFEISTKELNIDEYQPILTGYFNAQLYQQRFDYDHHKTILHLENQWGHVVALNLFLDNKKIASTQELDIIIETDEANVPFYSGTGLEDFFYYVHEFIFHKNHTGPFNGVPYQYRIPSGRPRRIYRCYRHMVFDPIFFTTSIRIYLESICHRYKHPTFRQFWNASSSFSQPIQPDSLLTVVLYYGGKGSGGTITDKVEYHEANGSLSRRVRYTPDNVESFLVRSMFENQPGGFFNRTVASMKPSQQATHVFNISMDNVGVILRREYRTVVPNQKAEVKVDGEDAGIWFCPQRAMTEDFSLRLSDYLLPPQKTAGKKTIEVTLKAITRWESISIRVLSVLITK